MINYYLITKPGIIMGNLLTFTAGFMLASRGAIDVHLFFATLCGLTCIMASACVFNNYIDRHVDKKMKRTKNRPLAKGLISVKNALVFAVTLEILGNVLLLWYANFLTAFVAGIGFVVYVVIYSFWKSRTIYGTAIGSIAGAVPPVVGYCAVSNQLDLGALSLFAMMVFWQMPHFFAIAMYHLDDYTAANIPVLPVEKGAWRTKIHMTLYIVAFTLVATLLTFFNYTGFVYLAIAGTMGLTWLGLCLKGFRSKDNQIWGREMFRFSLATIAIVCFVIALN